jgi:spermidine/putrescine transport system substrate-binding protein
MVTVMIKSDVIQKLDKSRIPNTRNVGEDYMGLSFDPNNEYSLPYQWGTTGILYNKKETGELDGTWGPMWDPKFEGQIAMLADSRETIGAALYKLGYSVNTKDDAELSEAEAELKKQEPLLRGYFISTEVRPLVQNGDILLGHVYSGDAFLALAGNEDLDYIIPQPIASRWTDNMCIPNGAPHPDNAHKFINHVLAADVGAALSNYTYYNTPNQAALPKIDPALKDLPGYTLTPEIFERLEVIEDVGAKTREYERIFTEVRSA